MMSTKILSKTFNLEEMIKLLNGKNFTISQNLNKSVLACLQMAIDVGEISSVLGSQDQSYVLSFSPYKIGDLICVRETWGVVSHDYDENNNITEWIPDRPSTPIHEMKYGQGYYNGNVIYRADGEMTWSNDYGDEISAWKPSSCMPNSVSRMTLKVTGIRIAKNPDHKGKPIHLQNFPYVWLVDYEIVNSSLKELQATSTN